MIGTDAIDPNRVAEIIVTSARDGSEWRGSGYRVTAAGILTAAHVVTDAASVRVRFNARRPDERTEQATVAWLNADSDVAVLAIQPGGSEVVDPIWFGRMADRDVVISCRTMGFPLSKHRPDTKFRDSDHEAGTIALLSNRKAGDLEIRVTAPADGLAGDASPWEGMSGAAVWSRGRLIGLIRKHYRRDGPGRLTALRIDRLHERLSQADLEQFCSLTGMPRQPGDLEDVLAPDEASVLRAGNVALVRDIAPARLHGREEELAEMARFCRSSEPYFWWQAPPWAGKTALAAWFVLHPPPDVSTVSFFVTHRLAGQADSEAFTAAIIDQLAALAGETVSATATPASRDRERHRLLELAAARARARGRRLVLVVDGLDEDAGAAPGSRISSIAKLLPRRPPDGTQVIVTGRPSPGIPGDVPADHPLRRCVPHLLSASQHALGVETEAKAELTDLLTDSQPVTVDVAGLITAAGGGLTMDDLAELAGQPRYLIESILSGSLGRSVGSRAVLAGPAADTDRVYLFMHETLARIAEEQFGHGLLRFRERIHNWASTYRRQGWPADSPQYLLRPYGQMLARLKDPDRLVEIATDYARQDRMLSVSFGDETALAEIASARDLLITQPSADLRSLALLAVSTDRLSSRNHDVPAGLPATWARLGQVPRAGAVARSISDQLRRAEALASVAWGLGPSDLESALAMAAEAQQAALAITDPFSRAAALGCVAKALISLHRFAAAEDITRSMAPDYYQAVTYAAIAVAVGEFDAKAARRLAAAAHDAISRYDAAIGSPVYLARLVAQLTADLAPIDPEAARQTVRRAEEAADSEADPFWRIQALVAIVHAQQAIDGGQALRTAQVAEDAAMSLAEPRQRVDSLQALVAAVAPADLERARRIALRAEDIVRSDAHADPSGPGKMQASLVQSLASVQLWDAAWHVINQAEWTWPGDLGQALSSLAAALARSDMWEAAEQAARTISDSWAQSDALLLLSGELLRAGHVDAAGQAAASISDGARRAQGLAAVASALIPLDATRAGELGEAAEQTAREQSRPAWHDETLAELVGALTEQQQWETAERVAQAMIQPHYRAPALAELASGLARAYRPDDVRRVLETLSGAEEISRGAAGVASALCAARYLDEAEEVVNAGVITDPFFLTQALAAMASALAPVEIGRARLAAERAEQAARTIPRTFLGGPRDTEALVFVVGALACVHCWDAAEELARSISYPYWRARALAVLAGSLAAADAQRARSIGEEAQLLAGGGDANSYSTVEGLALVGESLAPIDEAWALATAEGAMRAARTITDPLQQSAGLARAAEAFIKILGPRMGSSRSPGTAGTIAFEVISEVLASPGWPRGLRAAARIDPAVSQAVSAAILGELAATVTPGSEGHGPPHPHGRSPETETMITAQGLRVTRTRP